MMQYTDWSNKFVAKELRRLPEYILEKELGEIQPSHLTTNEMLDLGFRKWSESSTLMLIPLWLFPFLAEEIEVEDINVKKHFLKKSELGFGLFGLLSFGVYPSTIKILTVSRYGQKLTFKCDSVSKAARIALDEINNNESFPIQIKEGDHCIWKNNGPLDGEESHYKLLELAYRKE